MNHSIHGSADVRLTLRRLLLVALGALVIGLTVSVVSAHSASAAVCADCDGGGIGGDPPTSPPPPPPSVCTNAPPAGMKCVAVRLLSVTAHEIEDVCCFGAAKDEFYLLGNLSIGQNASEIHTNPTDIGSGDTIALNQKVLEVNVPADAAIHFSMDAFDQDAGQVFEHLPDVIKLIGTTCTILAPFDPSGIATTCAANIPAATQIAEWLKGNVNDPDDKLGTWGKDWALASLPTASTGVSGVQRMTDTWHFDKTGGLVPGWSDWDYDLQYDITVRD